jgi:hypothetical protein
LFAEVHYISISREWIGSHALEFLCKRDLVGSELSNPKPPVVTVSLAASALTSLAICPAF